MSNEVQEIVWNTICHVPTTLVPPVQRTLGVRYGTYYFNCN